MDFNRGAAQYVAVGAAAIDGAVDMAACDGNKGAVDIAVGLAQFLRIVMEAFAAAKHISVQAGVIQRANDGIAADIDRGVAHDFARKRSSEARICYGYKVDKAIAIHHRIPITHAGHVAAAKHVAVDLAARDVNIRVAIHASGYTINDVHLLLSRIANPLDMRVDILTIAAAKNVAEAVGGMVIKCLPLVSRLIIHKAV